MFNSGLYRWSYDLTNMTQFGIDMHDSPTVGTPIFVPNGISQYWGQYPYYRVYRVDYSANLGVVMFNSGSQQIMQLGVDTHVGLPSNADLTFDTLAESPGFKYIHLGQDASNNTGHGRTLKGTVYLPRVKAQSSTQFKGDETNRIVHEQGQSIGLANKEAIGDVKNHVLLQFHSNVPSAGAGLVTAALQYNFVFYVEWFGHWTDRTRSSTTVIM